MIMFHIFLIKRCNQSNSIILETSLGNVSLFREKINEVICIHVFIGCVLLAPFFKYSSLSHYDAVFEENTLKETPAIFEKLFSPTHFLPNIFGFIAYKGRLFGSSHCTDMAAFACFKLNIYNQSY